MFFLQLVGEGKINPDIFIAQPEDDDSEISAADKRGGARLGFCIKMSPSGSLISRPCWKTHGEYTEKEEITVPLFIPLPP